MKHNLHLLAICDSCLSLSVLFLYVCSLRILNGFDLVYTDSCEDMVIEDCYISVGDDGIAIKSGWDQYGIAYGRPSKNILIRNLVVRSMVR